MLVVHKTFIDVVDPDATDYGRVRSASAPAGFRQPRVRKWIPLPVQVGDLRPKGGVNVSTAHVSPVAELGPVAAIDTSETSRQQDLFVCVVSDALVIQLDNAGQPSIVSDYTVRCAVAVMISHDYRTFKATGKSLRSDSPTVITISIVRIEQLTCKHASKGSVNRSQIANESGCL